jgi:small subunit ribosomal protein S16
VGFYNPVGGESTENLRIALDRVQYWTGNGAQLSPAVERLVKEYSAKVAA